MILDIFKILVNALGRIKQTNLIIIDPVKAFNVVFDLSAVQIRERGPWHSVLGIRYLDTSERSLR